MKNKFFLIVNIIVPIVLGGIIYFYISPEVIFVRLLKSIFGGGGVVAEHYNNRFEMFTRYYLLDMLWAYSLVFALFLCLGNSAAIKKTVALAFVFSTVMELLQLIPIVPGIFDIWDIVVECIAETIAALVMYKYFL